MELSLSAQTQAFVYSCALGAILSVIYTAMGIIKIMSPPSRKLLFFMDLIFMLVCTVTTFLFSVAMTWGSLRYYVVFGELVGFFLFYLIVGELILKCSKAITGFLSNVYFFLTNPFRRLFKKLFSVIAKLTEKLRKKLKFKKRIKIKRKPKKANREENIRPVEKLIITARPK